MPVVFELSAVRDEFDEDEPDVFCAFDDLIDCEAWPGWVSSRVAECASFCRVQTQPGEVMPSMGRVQVDPHILLEYGYRLVLCDFIIDRPSGRVAGAAKR